MRFMAIAAACLALASATTVSVACEVKLGTQVASQVSSDFAALVHFTKVTCAPSNEAGKCTLMCVSDLNIEGANRDLALTMITASAATHMRQAGLQKFSRILFADRSLLLNRRALTLPASKAAELQKGFSTSKEKPLQMAARVAAEYKQYLIDKPKQ